MNTKQKLAKLLLEGKGCHDCEYCGWHYSWKNFNNKVLDNKNIICYFKNDTKNEICEEWKQYNYNGDPYHHRNRGKY